MFCLCKKKKIPNNAVDSPFRLNKIFILLKWEVQEDTDAMSSSITQCRDIAMPPKCFSKEIIRCAIRLRRIFFCPADGFNGLGGKKISIG